jgi:hypothetical protein
MKLSQNPPRSQDICNSPPHSLEESLDCDPYSLFLFAINSPETKEKYVTRLKRFFDFIGINQNTMEGRCKQFVDKSKIDSNGKYALNSVIRFPQMNKESAKKGNHWSNSSKLCQDNQTILRNE